MFSEIVIAALLHNIGCFYKSDEIDLSSPKERNFVKTYEKLLKNYVDYDLLFNLSAFMLQQNNSNAALKPYADIVSIASKLSSLEKADNYGSITKPLSCVFSSVVPDENKVNLSYIYSPLSSDTIFPNSEIDKESSTLLDAFSAEIERMQELPPKDFTSFLQALDMLFLKYLWCVPQSCSDEDSDVPLYDHLRTTAAIASALYKYHYSADDFSEKSINDTEKTKFILAAGELTGAKEYSFDAADNIGLFNARGLIFNALLKIFSHYILEKTGLTHLNLLMSYGDRFVILLPNTKETEELLLIAEREINEYLFEKFKGEVSFNFVLTKFNSTAFNNFSDIIENINVKLSSSKNMPFAQILQTDGFWDREKFVIEDITADKIICNVCQKEFIDKDKETCENCLMQKELGEKLFKAKYIVFSKDGGEYNLFKDYFIRAVSEIPKTDNIYLIEPINSAVMPSHNQPLALGNITLSAPISENGLIAAFSGIAKFSKGLKQIGLLMVDADNLKFVFSDFIKKPKSIARIAAMSRMSEMFFIVTADEIIKKSKTVCCLYSGGGRLCFLGPWNLMPDIALEIKGKYNRFTGNADLTLSAAILQVNSHIKVKSVHELTEKKLTETKTKANNILYPEKKGKNGIYFGGEIFTWEDFYEQISIGKHLENYIKRGIVSASIMKRLAQYSNNYKTFLRNKDVNLLIFDSHFYYDKEHNYRIVYKDFIKFMSWAENLYKNAANYNVVKKDFWYTESSINYALNKTREDKLNVG